MSYELEDIDEPIQLKAFEGMLYDAVKYRYSKHGVIIDDEKIAQINDERDGSEKIIIPDRMFVLPGRIDMHVHGREVFGIKPGEKGDQTCKEDSRTLSLALAQGGATHGVCMPNLGKFIENQEDYDAQLDYINSTNEFRKKPIMPLSMYVLVRPDSRPQVERAIFKLMWNTFGPTNFEKDEDVPRTLRNYTGEFVTAHCETISGMVNNKTLPHHEQRPTKAAIDAVKIFLDAAERYHFHAHVAHISSAEEVRLVTEYKRRGVSVSCEVTPQSITLNHNTFERETGLPLIWLQQNPPVRNYDEMIALREQIGNIDVFATDHAPHTFAECEKGISGKVQAPTAGQVYLEHVTSGKMKLSSFVEKSSINPGRILEERLGLKMGRMLPGYDASFTIVSLGKESRIRNEDVLSKPGYTPYNNFTFSNTIEGVIINGTLYTQKALQKLR